MSASTMDSHRFDWLWRMGGGLSRLVWWCALLVLVVVALLVGLGRQWMPSLASQRADLETWLTTTLNQPVTLAALRGRWIGLDPVVELEGLKLSEAGQPEDQIRIGQASLRLDSVNSLLRQQLVFRELRVRGVELVIRQDGAGQLSLAGLGQGPDLAVPDPDDDAPLAEHLRYLLAQLGQNLHDPLIEIEDSRIGLAVEREPLQWFRVPALHVLLHNGWIEAQGKALQPDKMDTALDFKARGRDLFKGHFTGELYLAADAGGMFDSFLQRYDWKNVAILGLDGGVQAWIMINGGRLQQMTLAAKVPLVELGNAFNTLFPLEDLNILAQARFDGAQRWLDVQIAARWREQLLALPSLQLRQGEKGWSVALESVQLAPWREFLQTLQWLPAEAEEALAGYAPSGELRALWFDQPRDQPWALRAGLQNVSVQAVRGAPAIDGLQGVLQLDEQGGRAHVNAGPVRLGFPNLFNTDWTLQHLKGDVHWQFSDAGTAVFAEYLDMQLDPRTRLQGRFRLELTPDKPDSLQLAIGLKDGTAAMLPAFVPAYSVSENLYQWLVTAVRAVDITEGWYYGQGCIEDDSPACQFHSRLWYQFDNAQVLYHPDWPIVDQVRGRVDVDGSKTRVRLEQAHTGGLNLQATRIEIDSSQVVPQLKLEAAASVPPAEIPGWLTQTPLRQWGAAQVDNFALTGRYDLKLMLGLPLGPGAPVVDARIAIRKASVNYLPEKLVWRDLDGELRYRSREGITAEGVTGRFLDNPVSLTVASAEIGHSLIQKGTLEMEQLAALLGRDAIPAVTGEIAYEAQLDLSEGRAPNLQFDVDLTDVEFDWPEPFDKVFGKPQRLLLQGQSAGVEDFVWEGRMPDLLAVKARWQDGRLERGQLAVGLNTASLPDRSGFEITGSVPHLDVGRWKDFLGSLSAPETSDESHGQGATIMAPPSGLNRLDVSAKRMTLGDQVLTEANLHMSPYEGQGWFVSLDSSTLSGRFTWPEGGHEAELKLTKADLTFTAPEMPAEDTHRQMASGLEDWPVLLVSVDRLSVNGNNFGRWAFRMQGLKDALRLSSLQGSTGDLRFTGQMDWKLDDLGNPVTAFGGVLEGKNFAELSAWLQREMPVTSQSTHIELDADWVGAPWDFALTDVSGSLSFRLDKGVILEKNATAQMFRVFGVLNSDTLWRRLKLDFSDLYQAGVTYDAMAGNVRMHKGTLTLNPDLQLVGPSGAFRLSGSTQLTDESLNMQVVVVLPLTQNLPLAALLLGATPPVGGALFLLDRVLGDPLSKLASATYAVSGNWSEPSVRLRSVFDTSMGGFLPLPDLTGGGQ